MRKIIVYIATITDGYIARLDGDSGLIGHELRAITEWEHSTNQ